MCVRWFKSSVIGLLILFAAVASADGYVIYSSWESEWRARTDAVRTSKLLNVDAEVRPAQLSGKSWYRVVVHVDSQSAEQLMLDAFDKDWDVWYLSATDSSWSASIAHTSKPLFSEDGDADIVGPARLIIDPSLAKEEGELDRESVDSTQSESMAALDSDSSESKLLEDANSVSSSSTEMESSSVDEEGQLPDSDDDLVAVTDSDGEPTLTDESTSLELDEDPPVDSDDDLASSADSDREPTLTVESTLREVELIQQQAQDLISNWVQREDQTTYQMPIEIDNETPESQNLVPTRETWFNVLRIPERRRR